MKTILVTGGCGYIGSHICVELLKENYKVIIVDNLSNNVCLVKDIEELTVGNNEIYSYIVDLNDYRELCNIFHEHRVDVVIHLAAYKSVPQSIDTPILYYENNISNGINLLKVMDLYNCHNLIFSSSCTVYGTPESSGAISEETPTPTTQNTPYGFTKYTFENILQDLCKNVNKWNVMSLRYFNPISTYEHTDKLMDPLKNPGVVPVMLNSFYKDIPFKVYGNSWNTPDGTCIRDYIHVIDVATAHIKSIDKLSTGYNFINIGTGKGTSIFELIDAFNIVFKVPLRYEIYPKRKGDIEAIYASNTKAMEFLQWTPQYNVVDMFTHLAAATQKF